MLKKTLTTERLTLSPLYESDLEDALEILTNDTVKKTYMLPDLPARADAVRLFERLLSLSSDARHCIVGVRLGEKLIGFINDTEISEDGKAVELGWAFNPEFYNRGYATEAVSAIIEYLLDNGFWEVTAGAFEGNLASQRVMEKSGMTCLEKSDAIEYRGKIHKCVYYSRKKAQNEKKKA